MTKAMFTRSLVPLFAGVTYERLEGYKTLYRLADTPNHIVPGHDPLVMKYYPALRPDLDGIVVRLDVPPSR